MGRQCRASNVSERYLEPAEQPGGPYERNLEQQMLLLASNADETRGEEAREQTKWNGKKSYWKGVTT